jgi:hypothetical protein
LGFSAAPAGIRLPLVRPVSSGAANPIRSLQLLSEIGFHPLRQSGPRNNCRVKPKSC